MQIDPNVSDLVLDDEETLVSSMTDDEILAVLNQEIASSAGALTSSLLSENRRQALKYYMGDVYGDEVSGRSQVVTNEVRDTIESVLPQLMKIFTASDQVVQFIPNRPEEEEGAKQATEYVNYLFLQKNKGFVILYTMFKDALLFKNGLVKTYWNDSATSTTETYRGLSEMERDALLQDEDVEPTAYSVEKVSLPGGIMPNGLLAPEQQVLLCDLTLKRTKRIGKLCVENVPPEEFLITQQASCIQSSRFVGHRCRKTASELVELGVAKEKAQSLAGMSDLDNSLERTQRFLYDGDVAPLAESTDKSAATVWVTECYLLLDTDNDGVAERWKITVAGDNSEILFREEWEGDWPFDSVSPILMPHKFYALSLFDLTKSYQRIQSTLTRQFLDNIYSLNNNRIAVNADRVNLDDLLTNRPNAIVRTIGNPAESLLPLQPSPLGAVLIPSLEYFNSQREKATGVTSYNQGLDADSLNKTASGISQIMGAAQERILLIARIFAETGISSLFQHMLELVCKHQDKEEVIRIRGKWVPIDPSQWASNMAAVTDVALGTNNRDQMLLHLNQVLSIQQLAMQSGLNLVTPKQIYNTLVKLVENTGLKHPELYFVDPDQAPPAQPKPSPEETLAQATLATEKLKAEASAAETKAKIDAENAQKLATLSFEAERIKREQADKAAERETKLQISREGNLTTLVTANMKTTSDEIQTKETEQTKKKPSRLEVDRDPKTGEIATIRPVYEEIMDVADKKAQNVG